ncbi:helix-turn-helix transcriptional regulator [Mediterranea massiliensis]|uniref:helix-turn-helix domain-containing protein n=1 Tax=Mediterranea massiliensis TaxID=1841865 RepID=UPI0023F1043C|nr:helix-turn-helix transcriptional regulator [Mediterranea massiliensis]
MCIRKQFGTAIIKLRKERGLSQERFAFEAGIDRRYMSDIENGRRNVSLDIIERIGNNLNLPLSELFRVVEQVKENE